MKLLSSWVLALALGAFVALAPACGRDRRFDDDDDTAGDGDADGDGDGDGDADGDVVPDPGEVVGGEWTDIEPNDDPSHAVPVGILAGPVWAGFAEPFTQLESTDDTDFFVFATGEAATLADVYILLCGPANTMDLYLSEVVDGHMGGQISSAAGNDTGCVSMIEVGQGPEILTATTSYVLEVRAQPGAAGASFPALYSA